LPLKKSGTIAVIGLADAKDMAGTWVSLQTWINPFL
jgi:hypothetical protein